MTGLLHDLRIAVRTLRKSPGFTAVAVLTLALGIGVNAAIFSVVDAVLLQPLPYREGERLAMLGDRGPDGSSPGNVGYATYEDFRDGSRSFESMAAVRAWYPTLQADREAERVPAMRVSSGFFPLLGVAPALGRGFLPEEDRPDTWRVALLSDGLWRRRFGADPSIVGRVVRLNDMDFRIVGVMPQGFRELVSARYYARAELWAPLGYARGLPYACRDCQHLKAIGRLAPGATLETARADLDGIRRRLAAEYPSSYPAGTMAVEPLSREIAAGLSTPLFVLAGAVGFVLLIACANVANLALTRSLQRSHEMAVRSALGASRRRLIQQVFAESLALAAAGGALGLALASALQATLIRLAPVGAPRLEGAAIGGRVLAFVALISIASALLSGILPAVRASAAGLAESLASGARGSAGAATSRARRALTAAELALAVVLVAGAFLMLRSVARLLETPLGFEPAGVLTMSVSLSGNAYKEDAACVAFQTRALERVRSLPGVEAAAFAGQIPLGGNGDSYGFHIEGRMHANVADDPSVERYSVTPDYFRVMGIPLVRGRLFDGTDAAGSVPVLIVSETAARSLWPGADPLGARVRIGGNQGPWRTVVGVAGDVRHTDVATASTPQMYLPQTQVTDGALSLVIRTRTSSPGSLSGAAASAIRGLDPGVPVDSIATMTSLVDRSAAPRRFVMQLLGAFAAAALLLAALGLYGVVSHAVARRTREIGIRVALGATGRDVTRLVLASGASTVVTGLAAGIAGSLVLMRLMRSVLYEISPSDPAALAGAAAVLAAAAIAAHWLPARRAARLDPVAALKSE